MHSRVPATDGPLVTVVIPVFNGEHTLEEAIVSVTTQSEQRLEILIVDDGSSDGSLAVAERAAAIEERVRVLTKPNGGVADARNLGLRAARAPYVALLDQDDLFLPLKMERQLRFAVENPEVAVIGTYGWRIGETGRTLGVFDVGPVTKDAYGALRKSDSLFHLLASSVMFRRDVAVNFGGFRVELGGTDDVDLWTRISDEHCVLTLPERLVKYRVHARSVSIRSLFSQLENSPRLAHNTMLRRSGRTELSVAEFKSLRSKRPRGVRAREWLKWRSRYAYRVAGGLLSNRQPSGALWILALFLLYPPVPIGRLRTQILPTFRRT